MTNNIQKGSIVRAATGWADKERTSPVLFSHDPYLVEDLYEDGSVWLTDYPSEKNSYQDKISNLILYEK